MLKKIKRYILEQMMGFVISVKHLISVEINGTVSLSKHWFMDHHWTLDFPQINA